MKSTLFMLVFFLTISSIAQDILLGEIKNEDGKPIESAIITNLSTSNTSFSNKEGVFKIKAKWKDIIEIKYIGKITIHYTITEKTFTEDIFNIVLITDLKLLNTVEVSSEKIKTVRDIQNENNIDYFFLDNKLITLTHFKRNYFLNFELEHRLKKQVELNIASPNELIMDCFGNVHILNKTRATQIYIDKTLHIIEQIDRSKYNLIIQPLIYANDNYLISENYSNNNQKYSLILYDKLKEKGSVIYSSWDKKAEKIAKAAYNKILYLYYLAVDSNENVIANKTWDGKLIRLAETPELIQRIIWYQNFIGKRLNIVTKKTNKGVFVFDFFKKKVLFFESNGSLKKTVSLSFNDESMDLKVILDKADNSFYLYNPNLSELIIKKINITTGKASIVLKIKEIVYPKNIKINDGWLYFLKNNGTGFHKLYKIKLMK